MLGGDGMFQRRGAKQMKKKIRSKGGTTGSRDAGCSTQASGMKYNNSSKVDHEKKAKNKCSMHLGNVEGSVKVKQSGGSNPAKPTVLRRKVDPETAKYFMEISNLFESNGVDMEERAVVCANALEEVRGKEVELATDVIISRTLQTLLEGCDLHQLCSFLQHSAKDFSSIAMDKNGSHVAETALKSLAVHLMDQEELSMIENALTRLCQAVVMDSVNMMHSRYGSHVIRSLLCLCKWVPLDSMEEFHVTKSSANLAERLNVKSPPSSGSNSSGLPLGFPDLLKFLVTELLKHSRDEIAAMRINKYSSFVLQTILKLLAREEHELMQVILIILGCIDEDVSSHGLFLGSSNVQEIMNLLEDTSSSHLVEVILEVAPENFYNEILEKVFRGSLFEISSHTCGNFVVQALIASSRCKDHVHTIWGELCPKIKELLAIGKAGVVASLLAACQRFQIHNRKCCEVLASSVRSDLEHPSCIIPHLLFLDNYLSCKDISTWAWPTGDRMHILGCLMLQTIFRYSKKFMSPYIESMVSIESDQLLEIAKDPGGSRVLESFLSSDVLSKQKVDAISKLQGHFGELSLHPSGSFTVEKCFFAGNILLKETIVSELASLKDSLSKLKHGPYIMKKLDIERYIMQPKHWKSSQAAKEAVLRDFQSSFLSSENTVTANRSQSYRKKRHKKSKSELSVSGVKLPSKRGQHMGGAAAPMEIPSKKTSRGYTAGSFVRHGKRKKSALNFDESRQPSKRKSFSSELAGKSASSAAELRKLFGGTTVQVRQNSIEKRENNFLVQNR